MGHHAMKMRFFLILLPGEANLLGVPCEQKTCCSEYLSLAPTPTARWYGSRVCNLRSVSASPAEACDRWPWGQPVSWNDWGDRLKEVWGHREALSAALELFSTLLLMVFCPRRLITSLQGSPCSPRPAQTHQKSQRVTAISSGQSCLTGPQNEMQEGSEKTVPRPNLKHTELMVRDLPVWFERCWKSPLVPISIVTGGAGHALTTRVPRGKEFWLDRWTHTHWKPHRPCLSSLRRSPQETRAWNWRQLIRLFLWYPCWMQVSIQVCQCHVHWTHPSDHGWTTLVLWLCHRKTLADAPSCNAWHNYHVGSRQ